MFKIKHAGVFIISSFLLIIPGWGKSAAIQTARNEWQLARHGFISEGAVILTGASISAGVGVHPIEILLKQNDPNYVKKPTEIKKIAMAGMSSRRYTQDLLKENTENINTVFAIDYFFWDSRHTSSACRESLQNIDLLTNWASKNKTRLVLGNIPITKKHNNKSCGTKLNAAIVQKCVRENNCYALDFYELNLQITRDGFVEAPNADTGEMQKYTPEQIRPDGLHFSEDGACIVAEYILRLFD